MSGFPEMLCARYIVDMIVMHLLCTVHRLAYLKTLTIYAHISAHSIISHFWDFFLLRIALYIKCWHCIHRQISAGPPLLIVLSPYSKVTKKCLQNCQSSIISFYLNANWSDGMQKELSMIQIMFLRLFL